MFKKIDESSILIKIIQRMSTLLARQRGLPIVIGIAFIVLGFLLELLNVGFNSPIIALIHITLRNIGILVALVGILLAQPLGN